MWHTKYFDVVQSLTKFLKGKNMKLNKKIALLFSAFVITQPVVFAESNVLKEIAVLELELVKLNTKTGEYSDWSDAKIDAKIKKTKKELEKKRAQAKKEAEQDIKKAKKSLKNAGNDVQNAGKEVGNAVKNFFD